MANFKMILNGKEVTVNTTSESWRRYGAWGHRAELFIDGVSVSQSSIRYYNRTWESYQYKTALHNAVGSYTDRLMMQDIAAYKQRNRLSRLPRGGKQSFERFYNNIYNQICQNIDKQHRDYAGGWTW